MENKMKKIIIALAVFMLASVSVYAGDMTKSGKNVQIWFDTGGPAGGSYGTVVYNGAKQAAFDTGADVKFMYSDWSSQKMIENFKKALSASPDGIVVMGHPGESAYSPLITEAEEKGIIVTCIDTPLPSIQENYMSQGFGYIGPDNYQQGKNMAKESIKRFGLKKGDKVLVWGLKRLQTRGLRARGIIEILKKEKIKVDYLEISSEIDKDSSLGTPVITGYISANPDVKAMIIDHGSLTSQMGNFLRAAGAGPDQISVAGFSLSPATAEAIEKGYVDLIGDAQPFLLGYLSVAQIVLTKKYGFSGLEIDTGSGFVGKKEISKIKPLAKKGLR
jgi:simple sugar transport system substrate-binding protein